MQITLPKKPKVITKDNFKAVIEVEDIYPGYGMTLGNALRRVLLSSLEGAVITIRKINYEVEDMRVGDRTDFNRLRVFMETDGTIDPEEAFVKAAKILVEQFAQLTSLCEGQISLMEKKVRVKKKAPKKEDTLKTKFPEFDFPARESGFRAYLLF